MKYLLSLGSAEKISEALEEKEIPVSPDEVKQIGALLRNKESGELTDEELEQASGGCIALIVGIVGTILFAVGCRLGFTLGVEKCG